MRELTKNENMREHMRELTDKELDFVAAGFGGSLLDVDVDADIDVDVDINLGGSKKRHC